MRHFLVPAVVSTALLLGIYIWFGLFPFITASLLTVLEVTLSFDNAVLNARVLEGMSKKWQTAFLTWGMIIAVLGTRLILPILIVSASVWINPLVIANLAAFEPDQYAHLLEGAKHLIYSFGAAFLLMVSLKYFFDASKEQHWIEIIEIRLSKLGHIEAIEIGFGLLTILGFSYFTVEERTAVLAGGIVGIFLFIFIQGFANVFARNVSTTTVSGLALFLYLNVLDSAFSLDSVVGAFALTTSVPIIMVGLGIGAWFVRSLTVYFVEKRTLNTLIYLQHGAHWAIFGLAASMFVGLIYEVPEIITGGIGLAFVSAAYWSSVKFQKKSTIILNQTYSTGM